MILGADAGGALRLVGSRGPVVAAALGGGAVRMRWASLSAILGNLSSVRLVPRRGLSQHTGWASGGTHRLSSLRGRPEHRLGGTRQARCRRSGVCFRRTVRASQSATVWDSSATSSRSRTRAQTGRHETGSVQAQWCLLPAHSPGVPQLWAEHSVGLIGGPPRGAGTETPAGVTFVSLRMLDFRRELERALHEGREGVRGERPLSQARRSPPATGRAGSRDRSFGLATKRPKVRALESSP